MNELISDCPACGATNGPMGALGNRVHYTCRDCGMQWSTLEDSGDCTTDDDTQETS